MGTKSTLVSIGRDLAELNARRTIHNLESPAVIEAAALRAAEAARGLRTGSGINKVELDLFTVLVCVISVLLMTIGLLGVLFALLPGSSPT